MIFLYSCVSTSYITSPWASKIDVIKKKHDILSPVRKYEFSSLRH